MCNTLWSLSPVDLDLHTIDYNQCKIEVYGLVISNPNPHVDISHLLKIHTVYVGYIHSDTYLVFEVICNYTQELDNLSMLDNLWIYEHTFVHSFACFHYCDCLRSEDIRIQMNGLIMCTLLNKSGNLD